MDFFTSFFEKINKFIFVTELKIQIIIETISLTKSLVRQIFDQFFPAHFLQKPQLHSP